MADQASNTASKQARPEGSFFGHLWLVWKRELSSYFSSPVAYVFITLFLFGLGVLFVYYEGLFSRGEATVAPMFKWIPRLFVLLIPLITMGKWAEERNSGTIEVLTTLPLRTSEVLLGKFLGAWSFVCVAVLFTLPIPILVSSLTEPGRGFLWGSVFGGYIGTFLLAAALCSIGLYFSSLTRYQILAAIVTLMFMVVFVFIGQSAITDLVGQFWPGAVPVISYVSPLPHFEQISQGVLHLKSIVYFLSVTMLFLFLNHTVMRSWKYRV